MSRLIVLKPLAREGASITEATLERVLIEEYGWQRAQVVDLLKELRKHG